MGGVREYHRVGRYTLSQIGQDEDNEGRDIELINVDSDMSSLNDLRVSRNKLRNLVPRGFRPDRYDRFETEIWVMSVAVADEDSEETVTDELSRRGRRTSCKGKL